MKMMMMRSGTLLTQQQQRRHRSLRYYLYTNANNIKKYDPYAILGLTWGDVTTQTQIKQAFRNQAMTLHPDVNTTDSRTVAIQKFQQLAWAYETLIKSSSQLQLPSIHEPLWQWNIWFHADTIAQNRTDVAGTAKRRPLPSISVASSSHSTLGHPTGTGSSYRRHGEYLTTAEGTKYSSSSSSTTILSVGTGHNKWVTPKPYIPWSPVVQSHHQSCTSSTSSSSDNDNNIVSSSSPPSPSSDTHKIDTTTSS